MRRKPLAFIADDEPRIRRAMRQRMTAWGFDVVEASDGLGVLAEHPKHQVDVFVLDHEMPNGDGKTIARVLRSASDAPIIFVSGHDREEFRSIVFECPEVYFLPKPLDSEKLLALLGSLKVCSASRQKAETYAG